MSSIDEHVAGIATQLDDEAIAKHLLEQHQAQPPIIQPPTPTAAVFEGHGAESQGGYSDHGEVYFVTHLGDKDPGSLRAAVQDRLDNIPRVPILRVGGTITLNSKIRARKPYLTLPGQTAPGDGITWRDETFRIQTHHVIMQYMRFRGRQFGNGIDMRPWDDCHDVVLDHLSINGTKLGHLSAHWQWGEDENPDDEPDIRRITVQNCILAEVDYYHPTAMNFGGQSDMAANPPVLGSDRNHHNSIHHNMFVHNGWRNPLMGTRHTEIINNIGYNWSHRIGGVGHSSGEQDWINNHWIKGPMSGNKALVFEWIENETGLVYPDSSIYIAGNYTPSRGLTDPNADNWSLFETNEVKWGDHRKPVPLKHRRYTPLAPAPIPVTIHTGEEVPDVILSKLGTNRRLNGDGSFTDTRDLADEKFVRNFLNGTGPDEPPKAATQTITEGGVPYECGDDGIGYLFKDKMGMDRNRNYVQVKNPNTGEYYLREFLEGHYA